MWAFRIEEVLSKMSIWPTLLFYFYDCTNCIILYINALASFPRFHPASYLISCTTPSYLLSYGSPLGYIQNKEALGSSLWTESIENWTLIGSYPHLPNITLLVCMPLGCFPAAREQRATQCSQRQLIPIPPSPKVLLDSFSQSWVTLKYSLSLCLQMHRWVILTLFFQLIVY